MKKFISVLICILLFASLMPMSAFADEILVRDTPMTAPKHFDASQTKPLENVTDIKALSDYIVEKAASCPSSIDISSFKIKYSNTVANALTDMIYYETPELFHISGVGYSYYSGGNIVSISLSYQYTSSEYKTALAEMKAAGEKLLTGVRGNNNLTDVEKALILHDRLAVWAEYDVDFATGDDMYTAYGILVHQIGVCMGYALAYDYLLTQVGIDNYYCSSDALNHAWNIVMINNKPYHVDVTWDDPTYDKTGRVNHDNFLRSTQGIVNSGHIEDGASTIDYISDPVDTTYDSYYWQNSTSAFQLIGNDIYYLDNESASIKKVKGTSTQTVVSGLDTKWYVSGTSGSYYNDCYSRLSSDGTNLYYSNSRNIHKYDLSTQTSSVVWNLTSSKYKIYGFKWENCKFVCDMNDSPNYTSTTKTDRGTETTHHAEGGKWEIDKFATSGSDGTTHKSCSGCAQKLTGTTSTKSTAVACASGTTLDAQNRAVFSSKTLVDKASNFLTGTIENSVPAYAYGSTKFYGTGSTITVKTGTNENVILTVIIDGDLNGDSVCDVLDAQLTVRYLNNHGTPTDAEIYAANGYATDSIDLTAYQSLVNKAVM